MVSGAAPERCPVCFTELPKGADRCPQCGRVFGAADRCPHCHAVAGVERSSDGSLRCAACGRPREPQEGLTVRGERADVGPGGLRRPRGVAVRATAVMLKAAGVGLGLLGLASTALLSLLLERGHGLLWAVGATVSLLLLGAGWGLGAVVDRWSLDREAQRRRRLVEDAARLEGGRITVARAAELLKIPEREADALLTSWVDGEHVRVELAEAEGTIEYVFGPGPGQDPAPVRVRLAESTRAGGGPEADAFEEAALEEGTEGERTERAQASREDPS